MRKDCFAPDEAPVGTVLVEILAVISGVMHTYSDLIPYNQATCGPANGCKSLRWLYLSTSCVARQAVLKAVGYANKGWIPVRGQID